jgi:hypothetical protein
MIRIYFVREVAVSLALASLVACGGESIDFSSDAVGQSTGGQTSSGGASSTGATSSGGVSTGGVSTQSSSFTRGGYAGGMPIVVGTGGTATPNPDAGSGFSCGGPDGGWRYYYDAASCDAGTLCSPACSVDADCPTLDGRATSCIGCDKSGGGGGDCSPEGPSCALTCGSKEDCPSGMNCLPARGGYTLCMFADVPWAPGCEGYCARGDEKCGDGAPCCDGLTCSPWGTCEDRTCVDFAWECGEGLPPCCDPFSCIDGFCQSTP